MTKDEKVKLDWLALELRIKTLESLLGSRYTDALKLVLKTMYDEHKIVAIAKELDVSGRSVLEQLEKMRKDIEAQERVALKVERDLAKKSNN